MKIRNLNDQELLKQYSVGNDDAISVIIDRYKVRVFNYIRNMVKSEAIADDIFQDTFIKVIKSLENNKYTDNGKLLSWILRIAHNQVIDYFRHNKQQNRVSTDVEHRDVLNDKRLVDNNIEDKLVSDQLKTDVRHLVDQLSEDQREVVVMRYYLGLSFKDIAEMTGVSINTSLGRMRYALINLRKLLEDKSIALS